MNREDVKKVLSIINVAYPNFYKNSDKNAAVNLWELMFVDDDVKSVLLAVKAHISTNVYPPTIANIRASIVDVQHKRISSDEAWGQITTAIKRCGYSRSDEVHKYVDPEVMPILKRMGFKELCMSQNQMADRAHFIKMWEANQKNDRYNKMLSISLKKEIDNSRLTSIKDLLIEQKEG